MSLRLRQVQVALLEPAIEGEPAAKILPAAFVGGKMGNLDRSDTNATSPSDVADVTFDRHATLLADASPPLNRRKAQMQAKTTPEIDPDHLPDILPDADLEAIKRARGKGQKNFDSKFFEHVPQSKYTLPDVHISTRPPTAKPRAVPSGPVYNSSRLQWNPDGSADVSVGNRDSLWTIARDALKENQPRSFRPTNESIVRATERLARQNHLVNDALLREKQVVNVPKDIFEAAQGQGSADVPVEVINASPAFEQKIRTEFQSLPDNERRLLKQAGVTLVITDRVTDAVPELVGVTPRGWPQGTTWDDTDGLYQPGRKLVVVAETMHNLYTGQFQPTTRGECVMRHETGHGEDAALGAYSHGSPFAQAYKQDVSQLSDSQKQAFAYLLQPGVAGKEETFAEMFAGLNGCTANRSQTVPELNGFPTTKDLVQGRLSQLP